MNAPRRRRLPPRRSAGSIMRHDRLPELKRGIPCSYASRPWAKGGPRSGFRKRPVSIKTVICERPADAPGPSRDKSDFVGGPNPGIGTAASALRPLGPPIPGAKRRSPSPEIGLVEVYNPEQVARSPPNSPPQTPRLADLLAATRHPPCKWMFGQEQNGVFLHAG
jgi:hypothetical protein